MNYLNHKSEFGDIFDANLKELEKDIRNIYQVRNEYESTIKGGAIRLHSSTLDYKSTFACLSAILKNKITMGQIVKLYERNYSEYIGGSYEVLTCNSGSSANLLAISTLIQSKKLNRGDKVIVPALSWSTTIFPLVQYGLIPIFCDCNDLDFNISIENLERLVGLDNPRALMLIHTYGCPPDMDVICNLCSKNNMILIEDTCESMGAKWDGRKAGTFGEISTFSSYYSHHICTLEGGLTCFKDKSDLKIAESVRSHGWLRHLSKEDEIFKEYPQFDPSFLFNYVGYNLRLSEPQAAIGIEQLEQLDSFIENRSKSAKQYTAFFNNFRDLFKFIKPKEKAKSSWFGFPLVLKGNLKGKRNVLRKKLLEMNIESRPFLAGEFPIQPVVKNFEHIKDIDLAISKSISEDGLAIPCHQDIKKVDVEKICLVIKDFINETF